MQVSEARRANGAGEKPASGLKQGGSASTHLTSTEHHFNFMQVSRVSGKVVRTEHTMLPSLCANVFSLPSCY